MQTTPSPLPSLAFDRTGSIRRGQRAYRLTTLLTVFAMLFGGILLLTAPVARAGSPTVHSQANLYAAPAWDADIVAVLSAGTPIEVTGNAEGDFTPVSAAGYWGYVPTMHVDWSGGETDAVGGSGGDAATNDPAASAEDEWSAEGDPAAESDWSAEGAATDDTAAVGNATWSGGGERLYVFGGALNLRSGPSTSDGIVTVMRDGGVVTTTGESVNGFLGVTYNGMNGYAFAEYLSTYERVQTWEPTGETPAEETPGETPQQPGSVPVGDTVTGTATVVDGPLNLRSGPSTSYEVLAVMPHGASLELMGAVQDGFHPVRFNGVTGWASAEFIGVDGNSGTPQEPVPTDPAPTEPAPTATVPAPQEPGDDGSVPVPGDSVIGTAIVIDGALNLRSGPSTTYNVLAVMPNSAEVGILGEPQAGFYPVRYNGMDGWAFAEYLSVGGAPDPGDGDDGGEPTPEPTTEPEPDPGTGNGDTNGDGVWSRDELVAIITDAANAYGQPVEDMIRVAACESVWDPYAVNSSSGASGLFQFMPGTWLTTPYADQDIFDPVANANAAAWMWSVGRRNEWTCQ